MSKTTDQLLQIKQTLAAKGVALEDLLTPEQLKLFRGNPSSVITEEFQKLTAEAQENFPDPAVLYCMELLIQKFTRMYEHEGDLLGISDEKSPFLEYSTAVDEVSQEEAFRLLKTMFRHDCFIQKRKPRSRTESSVECPI